MLLAARPCCAEDHYDASAKKCLVEKKEQDCSKDPDCRACSPFFACSSCTAFMISTGGIEAMPFIATDAKSLGFFYKHPYLPQIYLSIWQPPKLA